MQMNETIEQLMARHEAVFGVWMELLNGGWRAAGMTSHGIVLRKNGELWMCGAVSGARVVELVSRPGSLDVERHVMGGLV